MANTNLLQQWQQLQTEYARLQNDFIAFGKYIQNFGQMFGNVSDINVSNVTPISRGRRAHASVTTQRRGRRARAA